MQPFDPVRRSLAGALALAPLMATLRARAAPSLASLLTRPIPASGEALPMVGLGTWQAFDVANDATGKREAAETLRTFMAAHLRVIDTSPMYGSAEAVAGELLEQADPGKTAFVATKVWTSGADAGRRQIENSFRLLRREHIDLIQVHNLVDADTQLSTLQQLKKQGRIRYIGITHYNASAHAALVRYLEGGGIDFVQVNYSLAEREADTRVLPAAAAHKVAVLINRPLGEGSVLQRLRNRELSPLAQELGCTSWAQFALKYIISHPAVTCVIPGTRNPRHMLDNATAMSGAMPDPATRAKMAAEFDRT